MSLDDKKFDHFEIATYWNAKYENSALRDEIFMIKRIESDE